MLERTFLDREKMVHFEPILVHGELTALLNLHIDATTQNAYSHLVSCVCQLMNFPAFCNKVDGLQILFMEEWGEDVLLLFEMHRQLLRAGMEKILHEKLRFICPGTTLLKI